MAQARRMEATHDYIGKTPNELTFKKGDVIFCPNAKAEGDMLQGVFHGKVGAFPRIYVKDTTVEIKQPGKTTRVKSIAKYDAQPSDDGEELSFPKDAVMFVVARHSEKYWKGVWQGKAGLIHASYVQDATVEEKKPELAGLRCRAIKTFVNDDPTGLCFKIGDIVFVPKPDDSSDKWQGVSNSVIGFFPKIFVVDTAGKTKEELDAMIDAAKETDEEKAALAKFDEVMEKRKAMLGK
eukprot:m.333477 g.333477  ORF g.333477 m.333477 type:complete len:237 (+) comp17151_c1_seq1:115-825(+)